MAINARQTQWASAAGRSGPCAGNLRAKLSANYQISFDGNAGNKQDALMIMDGGFAHFFSSVFLSLCFFFLFFFLLFFLHDFNHVGLKSAASRMSAAGGLFSPGEGTIK